ncbi:MAG TPA: hypothetical protein DD444_16945 [Citreicella sp.]|jgi:hypothetical protein|nr:hypothetical protein [Citreicella sp.]
MTEVQTTTETNRDRVRRLLIEPLARRGFRFAKGTPPEEQTKRLNDLADSMGYLSDESLRVLEQCMRAKGQGSSRCFWPDLASFEGYAEAREPRPLGELPGVLRWFRSAAGAEALLGNRLVAEYEFWTARKRPPVSDRERAAVARRAVDHASKAERVRDRINRGLTPFEGDAEWLQWFDQTEAKVRGYLAAQDGNGGAE